jgi:general secretion pathway protein G
MVIPMNETLETMVEQPTPHTPENAAIRPRRRSSERGFTLIELIVVVTIIGILAGLAIVNVRFAQQKAREAALMDNLATLRKAIDNYYADKQHYPADLNDLVPNYVKRIPKDPITKQVDWEVVMDDPLASGTGDGDSGEPIPSETDPQATSQPGITDVKSVAQGVTLDNVPYTDL